MGLFRKKTVRTQKDRRHGEAELRDDVRVNRKPVTRRRVVYIAGYDPRGPEGAKYDLLERELERFCKRSGMSGSLTPVVHAEDGLTATWTMKLADEDWETTCDYLYLRWDDIVAKDFARGPLERTPPALRTLADYIVTGTLVRMALSFRRTVILWLYPFLAIALMVLACLTLAWVGSGFIASPEILGLGRAGQFGIAILLLGASAWFAAWLTRRTFIQHLFDLWIFCRDFAVGDRPDMEARCDLFAEHVLAAVAKDDVEETLLVGHSYGTMMMVEAVARALRRDPDAFAAGAPAVLLTLGSCINTSTLHPRAEARRKAVREVTSSDAVLWVEFQARQDMINYYLTDPAADAGLPDDPTRTNPLTRIETLEHMLTPFNYNRFRLNYFRLHYQVICANDYAHVWEYMLVVAGPEPLADRLDLKHWIECIIRNNHFYETGRLPDPESLPQKAVPRPAAE